MNYETKLNNFLAELTAREKYDAVEGRHYWQMTNGALPSGICSVSAALVATRFNGQLFGYPIPAGSNPALVAESACGHDYAIVADQLVDWWGFTFENLPQPVLPLSHPLIRERYLPRQAWQEISREKWPLLLNPQSFS